MSDNFAKLIKDYEKKEFKQGIYVNFYSNNTIGSIVQEILPEYYRVYKEGKKWCAEAMDGKKFELGIPQCMPDSERMPEGMLNSSDLVFVEPKNIKSKVKEIKLNFEKRQAYMKNLETFVNKYLPK